MKKRVLSLLLVLMLLCSLLPFGALADGQVRVIVENTTMREETYQGHQVPWKDQLFDITVDYKSGMTMDSALREASGVFLKDFSGLITVDQFLQYETSDWGSYLIGVNNLLNWGTAGWMASLNDWFDMNNGMDAVKVQPGDTVRVMYTVDWGADIGAAYGSADTGLKDLSFNCGVLYPAFGHDTTEYTLYVPSDVSRVLVTPTAANKYNKVFVAAAGEQDVRWGAREIDVSKGSATVTVDGGTAYTVRFKTIPENVNPFTDVAAGQYYYDPVLWAVNHDPQITNGTSSTTFSPESFCTRAQTVTFLWRANNCPKPTLEKNPFTDVPKDAYYSDAVLWAVENEITNGTSPTTFSPEATVTRGQTVTFLWRAEGKPAAGKTNPFDDVPNGKYYTDAVLWAVNHEPQITNGTSQTAFSPEDFCTRGQIVTFLYRDLFRPETPESPLEAAMQYARASVAAPKCGESDWTVFDAARNAAVDEPMPAAYNDYYATVEAKARATDGKMDAKYATDYARYVLTVTALGRNAADVAGYDLTERLSDVKYVTSQGVNGAIYALLALDSGDYASYARPDLIGAVLDAQLEDGGFTYRPGDPSDPDLTAMAIQALAPYLDDSDVETAVWSALSALAKMQQDDGGFFSWGASSSESTAQAIIAYQAVAAQPEENAFNRDPETLPGIFTKNGNTLMDNLLTFQLADGSFRHAKADETANGYATEQALRALVADQCTAFGVTLYGIR